MALIREASFPADLDSTQRLFLACRDTPGVSECVAGFEREVARAGRQIVCAASIRSL